MSSSFSASSVTRSAPASRRGSSTSGGIRVDPGSARSGPVASVEKRSAPCRASSSTSRRTPASERARGARPLAARGGAPRDASGAGPSGRASNRRWRRTTTVRVRYETVRESEPGQARGRSAPHARATRGRTRTRRSPGPSGFATTDVRRRRTRHGDRRRRGSLYPSATGSRRPAASTANALGQRFGFEIQAHRVVSRIGQFPEALLQPQHEQHRGVGAEGDAGITLLDLVQGRAADPGAFRHRCGGNAAASPGVADVRAELAESTPDRQGQGLASSCSHIVHNYRRIQI